MVRKYEHVYKHHIYINTSSLGFESAIFEVKVVPQDTFIINSIGTQDIPSKLSGYDYVNINSDIEGWYYDW